MKAYVFVSPTPYKVKVLADLESTKLFVTLEKVAELDKAVVEI